MASSLAKINQQIAKLQKQAEAIQNTVIARIRREIELHGLTPEHLFGTARTGVTDAKRAATPKTRTTLKGRKAGTDKPFKFADGSGNTWHGIGKRPRWIHEALASGRSLEDFLVDGTGAAPNSEEAEATPAKRVTRSRKAAATRKTAAGKRAKVSGEKAPSSPARKTAKSALTVKKASAKKAPAKKLTRRKSVAARGAEAQASQAVE